MPGQRGGCRGLDFAHEECALAASRERNRNSQQPHPRTPQPKTHACCWALPGTEARADTPEAGIWSGGVVQSAGLPCKPCCQRAHGECEHARGRWSGRIDRVSLVAVRAGWRAASQSCLSQRERFSPTSLSLQLRTGSGGFYSNNWGANPNPQRGSDQHRAKRRP